MTPTGRRLLDWLAQGHPFDRLACERSIAAIEAEAATLERPRLARALHVVDNDFGGGCVHTKLPTDIDHWDAIERDHGLYAGRLAGEYDR